jgi:hypothetical protein
MVGLALQLPIARVGGKRSEEIEGGMDWNGQLPRRVRGVGGVCSALKRRGDSEGRDTVYGP